MTGFLLRRLAASLLLLLLVLTFLFFFVHLIPGDPIRLFEGQHLTLAQQQRLQQIYGLDRPLPAQYLAWLAAVARWDWGTSIAQQRPVSTVLAEALPATAILGLAALAVEYALTLLLGIASALRRGSALDHAIRIVTLLLLLAADLLAGADGGPPLLLRLAGAAGEPHALGGRRPDEPRRPAARPRPPSRPAGAGDRPRHRRRHRPLSSAPA